MRTGSPDPLIYYLHAAALAHSQVIAAASGTAPNFLDDHLDEETLERLNQVSPWDIAEVSARRLSSALSGIDKWRDHPFQRNVAEPPAIWSSGSARLLDYGKSTNAPTVLVVPSLINRPYILDIDEDISFLRNLATKGLRPVLLDWGDGMHEDTPQTIDETMSEILRPAFEYLEHETSRRPSLLGYCMGGTLATGLATYLGERVERLTLIGAPWDFSEISGVSNALKTHALSVGTDKIRAGLQACGYHFGAIPATAFQQLFALLSPMQVVQKFSSFDALPQTSPEALKFVAVEDWLADGVSVKAPTAETILMDWYIENHTGRGRWNVFGAPVHPDKITCPTLVITGDRDHIVPPAVAGSIVPLIPDCQHHPVDMGHVGMIVGTHAHAQVADRISAHFDL